MTVAVFGPDPNLVAQVGDIGADIKHFRHLSDVVADEWSRFDAVVLDLQALRVETSGTEVDPDSAREAVQGAAHFNEDAFWLIFAPPGLTDIGHRLARGLAATLRGGLPASQVATEPHHMRELAPILRVWLDELVRLEGIEIEVRGVRDLTHSERRCIRRLLGDCDEVMLHPLGDGQSDAVVLRAECIMNGGHAPDRVLKVGPSVKIFREHKNYLDFARNRIGLARLPHHDTTDFWVAGPSAAMVYSLAGGNHPRTLHEVMASGDGCPAIQDLWGHVLGPWLEMREPATQPIAAFIDAFLDGTSLDEVEAQWNSPPLPFDAAWNPLPWLRTISGRVIDVTMPHVIAHGDLHAYNVLVDDASQAWLIDFYHTGWKKGVFDAAYSDVYLMLHRVPGRPAAVACSNEQLIDGEKVYYRGGEPARAELALVRSNALNVWGVDAAPLLHLARACVALRLLRFDSTDLALAKTISSLAAIEAKRLKPDWEQAPEVAPIGF
jgi:hypothetical protein